MVHSLTLQQRRQEMTFIKTLQKHFQNKAAKVAGAAALMASVGSAGCAVKAEAGVGNEVITSVDTYEADCYDDASQTVSPVCVDADSATYDSTTGKEILSLNGSVVLKAPADSCDVYVNNTGRNKITGGPCI